MKNNTEFRAFGRQLTHNQAIGLISANRYLEFGGADEESINEFAHEIGLTPTHQLDNEEIKQELEDIERSHEGHLDELVGPQAARELVQNTIPA